MGACTDWWRRPPDQSFLTLDSLLAHVEQRATRCETVIVGSDRLEVCGSPEAGGGLWVVVVGELDLFDLTHYSFGQLATLSRVPARWARLVASTVGGPRLVAGAIEHGLVHLTSRGADVQLRIAAEASPPRGIVRCIVEPDFGGISDCAVVKAVTAVNVQCGNRWTIPAGDPMLYASDRDVFLFLVDEKNPIEVKIKEHDVRTFLRGFYVWNSEVGDKTFGVATFLYDPAPGNKWVLTTGESNCFKGRSGLDEFLRQAPAILTSYADAPTKALTPYMRATDQITFGCVGNAARWLVDRGYTRPEARGILLAAEEEGGTETAWQLAQGAAALARRNLHTDDRLSMEKRASKLLSAVNR